MTFILFSQAFKVFVEPERVRADTSDGYVQNDDDLEHVSHYDSATAQCDACMHAFALPHVCCATLGDRSEFNVVQHAAQPSRCTRTPLYRLTYKHWLP